MKSYAEIEAYIKEKYQEDLWSHTLNTVKTAEMLAQKHNLDIDKSRLAALLHDYGKIFKDLTAQAKKLGLTPNSIENEEPLLLHGAVGALLASRDFAIDDLEVLSAIEKHTFGGLEMSLLDKVLYVSDMVEPDRKYPERQSLLRQAEADIESGFCACLSHKMQYILKKKKKLHPITVEVWNRCLNTKNTSSTTAGSY